MEKCCEAWTRSTRQGIQDKAVKVKNPGQERISARKPEIMERRIRARDPNEERRAKWVAV